MKTLSIVTAIMLGLASATVASAQGQGQEEDPACAVIYQGETSRVRICENKLDWTLPKDALRIDKPLEPGPNSLPAEVYEKLIEKPVKFLEGLF